ncbi:MAG: Bug family tripartite tricarboxylate transporter substrate binding protein [Betaproteobacteria bacterium]
MRRILSTFAAALLASAAWAQSYPSKPVRIIVPYQSGSSDVMARAVAPRLSDALKQPVLVENRPGANAIIGTDLVAKAPPDGYTFLMALTTHVISPSLMQTPFDPLKDFQPVAAISVAELGIGVNNAVPARTLQEFIAYAQSLPKPLPYAATQLGGNQHLAGELFTLIPGAPMQVIPYKGGGDAMAAVLGGHVLMYFGSMSSMTPVFKSGKLRGLAVTGNKRHPDFPEMPTFAEAGVPGFEIRLWYGLLAPAGTPREIVTRVSDIVLATVAQPDFQATLAKQGTEAMPMNPGQFAAFLRTEHARYLDIIKRANVKIEQ